MKKSIWIFLLAVLLPGFVLGWLALRSAEEQQIIFERRTAELYQKETEALAAAARDAVESERRAFGDTVHRLLARSDAGALARDFTNSLMDAWPRKAVGFVLGPDGQMMSPSTTIAAKNAEWREFLWNNGAFLCSTQPAVVYPVSLDSKFAYAQNKGRSFANDGKPAVTVGKGGEAVIAQKQEQTSQAPQLFLKAPVQQQEEPALAMKLRSATAQKAQEQAAQLPLQQQQALQQVTSPDAELAAVPVQREMQRPEQVAEASVSEKDKNLLGVQEPAQQPAPQAAGVATGAAVKLDSAREGLTRGSSGRVSANQVPGQSPAKPSVQAEVRLQEAAPRPKPAGSLAPEPSRVSPPPASPAPTTTPAPASIPAPAPAPPMPTVAPPETAEAVRFKEEDESSARRRMARTAEVTQQRPMPLEDRAKKAELAKETAKREPIDPSDPVRKRQAQDLSNVTFGGLPKEAEPEKRQTDALQEQEQLRILGENKGQLAGINTTASSSSFANAASNLRANDLYNRMVEPQQTINPVAANWSAVLPATADFRALTANNVEGMLARFVQDKLDLIFWLRPPEAPEMVFGCLVEANDLEPLWKDLFAERAQESSSERPPYVLALLNDKARPVATLPATGNGREWKRPFVASEVGEVLPHWEAALYLATPTAIADTARGLRRTLSFTIAAAIALIALGGWLVVADVRRQLAAAQQKTDFVSNVSHELKTPLTSIRMFAELMHDRPQPAEKQGQYLRIITVEAERLTRLINNVLDFAKLERRQKRFDKKPLDLCHLITRVWEGHEMHLRDAGFSTRWDAASGPYPVIGDEDALAQVLVNLLSNAEKYSQEKKEIELVTWPENGCINVSVLDRGMGVPDGEERKIFEAFYRAHDSLSSGIQGSGLGLTLAQRIAREHGGEIVFERRQGGGSRFTLRLPLVKDGAGASADISISKSSAGPD